MHGAVVTTTEIHEIVELRLAAVGPVGDVVCVAVAQAAAGEAAAPVAMIQRATHGGGNGAGSPADAEHIALRIVRHDYTARIAGEPPRRFRGNAYTGSEHRLAMVGVRAQGLRVHVHDHLQPVCPTDRARSGGTSATGRRRPRCVPRSGVARNP